MQDINGGVAIKLGTNAVVGDNKGKLFIIPEESQYADQAKNLAKGEVATADGDEEET